MDPFIVNLVITVLCALLASSGFWAWVNSKSQKETAEKKLLRGLAHDRIMELGEFYLQRGNLSRDEYENLHDYLYKPYRDAGGNGTAEVIMDKVRDLPIKEAKHVAIK